MGRSIEYLSNRPMFHTLLVSLSRIKLIKNNMTAERVFVDKVSVRWVLSVLLLLLHRVERASQILFKHPNIPLFSLAFSLFPNRISYSCFVVCTLFVWVFFLYFFFLSFSAAFRNSCFHRRPNGASLLMLLPQGIAGRHFHLSFVKGRPSVS